MRSIRLLKPEEIECRTSEIDRQGRYITLLLYKTARTDAALLDETFGNLAWQNAYQILDGKLYCGIGVLAVDDDGERLIWKWNVGTESNVEAEKGQASDAMKRAGFVWGIGSELYTAPKIQIPHDAGINLWKGQDGKWRCYDTFSVEAIRYSDDGLITGLCIVNDATKKRVYEWMKK